MSKTFFEIYTDKEMKTKSSKYFLYSQLNDLYLLGHLKNGKNGKFETTNLFKLTK